MKPERLHDPRIAVIGGGTGLSTMLRGLKKLSQNITAIVTVADDGGGSGMLREDLGMPPPGDVRNCIQALANTEPIMEKLLAYRFTDGRLKGQSFGNLFLAALNGMSDTFDEAVRRMSDVLAITGRVLPVTNENVYLAAEFDDGTEECWPIAIKRILEKLGYRDAQTLSMLDSLRPLSLTNDNNETVGEYRPTF